MQDARSFNWGRAFAIVAIIEAITWGLLLVGMLLKWVTHTTEVGVQVFGALHGAAFVIYVLVALVAAVKLRWSFLVTLAALLASIPPFFTLIFEVWARRRGLLDPPVDTKVPARA